MFNHRANIARTATWIATLVIIASPVSAVAEEPTALPAVEPTAMTPAPPDSAFRIADVELAADGTLHGQAVNAQGHALPGKYVSLDDGRRTTMTSTDAGGNFQFSGLQGGAYRVQVAGQTQFVRAWKHGTAPPSANTALMVVEGNQTILGQYCGTPVGCSTPVGGGCVRLREALRNPVVMGGIVAAAIAIPVAIHNSNNDDPAPAS
jgi:hypothetical protein